jgi:DNA-binding MarR family transcriptional regulator
MLDESATILKAINHNPCGVRELVGKLHWKTQRVVSLLKTMRDEGFIEFQENATPTRGRPKKIVVASTLGIELLETFEKCQRKAIQINHNDIRSAVYQANLAKKLEGYHVSSFQRFWELTRIALKVRNSFTVKDSAKTG